MLEAPSPKKLTATRSRPQQAERHRAAGGDRDVGADDGVGDHGADREVGEVHLPALAADAAGRLAPDLGRDRVERRALGDQVADRPMGAEDHVVAREAPSRRRPPPPPGPGTGAACRAPALAGRAGRGAPRSGGSAPSSQTPRSAAPPAGRRSGASGWRRASDARTAGSFAPRSPTRTATRAARGSGSATGAGTASSIGSSASR